MDKILHTEPREQLRSLYRSLVGRPEHLDEFRQLLSEYPSGEDDYTTEPVSAAEVREKLCQRIRDWTGGPFGGFTEAQMLMWRAIVIERRLALSSPWTDSKS